MLAFFRVRLIRCKLASFLFTIRCLENYNSGCSFRVCCRPPWICHAKQFGYIPVQGLFLTICIPVYFSQAAFFNRHSLSYVTLSEPQTSFVTLGHSWMHSHSSSLLLLFTQREKGAWHLFLQSINAGDIERAIKYSVEPVLTDTLVIRTPINPGKFLVSLKIQNFFFKKKKL